MSRRKKAASAVVAAAVATPVLRRLIAGKPDLTTSWHARITSHASFSHDSIDNLGYDWSRIANPAVKPVYPFKVYLPQTTEDVVNAVKESRQLGETLRIRGKGHSSNDLVLTQGSVLTTEKMNAVLEFDPQSETLAVQGGAVLADLDGWLADKGFGLPVIGDHNHITAGGFTSMGGFGPMSHRFGLFVDNVLELEYVNSEGEVRTCSRTKDILQFNRMLTGQGRFGLITSVKIKVIRIDKFHTLVENDKATYLSVEKWLRDCEHVLHNPGDALYVRCLWLEGPLIPGKDLEIGSIQLHRPTSQTMWKRALTTGQHAYLHTLGVFSGRVPGWVEWIIEGLGVQGLFFPPKYATIKNLEAFLDKVIDYSASDPNRFIIVWTPVEEWASLYRKVFGLMREYKQRTKCFTFITSDNGPIVSRYLAKGAPEPAHYVHMFFEVGINLSVMTEHLLDQVVSEIDDLCIEHGAYRYMHTKTVGDPERRKLVDPNTYYAELAELPAVPAS